MKKQSGDPMFKEYLSMHAWHKWYQSAYQEMLPIEPIKADISFQDTAQDIVDVVEKEIKPLMKRMTGRHYSKILEDLEKIRKMADAIRREASNLGI